MPFLAKSWPRGPFSLNLPACRASLASRWVNTAGIGSMAPFAEATEADFDALVNIHLKGVFSGGAFL